MNNNKTLTTYERRQLIVRILEEQSGIKVTELADMLDVSEGTVRNDLAYLDSEEQITRVRGGAIARSARPPSAQIIAERARVNADAKERIAQWAATMVEDGDTILLDASTTVLHMVNSLHNRRNLTIVTNGVEVARRLAEIRGNTVILLGGVLSADGNAISSLMSEGILSNLHVRTAFVSCTGFSLTAGLMESDVAQAQLKAIMISTAQRVVALVDHTKFDRLTLTSFSALRDINHLFTDNAVSAETIQEVCAAGVRVTVCSDHTTTTYAPEQLHESHCKIGFANLTEEITFGRDVRRGLEAAALRTSEIELLVADNRLSSDMAMAIADDFLAQSVDLMIEFQIDETVGNQLAYKFTQHGIPVIAVDIPMVGATFFGVDNYKTGWIAGVELGEAVVGEWSGAIDYLIVLDHPRAGKLPEARIQGQRDGIESIIGPIEQHKVITVDCGNTSEVSETAMIPVLNDLPRSSRCAIICFNDDAALGALEAAHKTYRAQDVLIVGQGADRRLRDELRRANTRIVGSTAFHPERYGEKLIELAQRILNDEPVAPAVYVDHTFISPDNVDLYYPHENSDR